MQRYILTYTVIGLTALHVGCDSGSHTQPAQVTATLPQNADILHQKAIKLCREDKHSDEVKFLEKAIVLQPNSSTYHNDLGAAFLNNNQETEAMTHFNEAIRLNPEYAPAYTNRIKAYHTIGSYQAALEDAEILVKISPDFAPSYYLRGLAKYKLGKNTTESIDDFSRAIELDPAFIPAYSKRIAARLVQLKKGKDVLAETLKDLDLIIELEPDQRHIYLLNRGIAYYNAGQYRNALVSFDNTVEEFPRYADAYNNRGVINDVLGKYEAAYDDFYIAAKLEPLDLITSDNLTRARQRIRPNGGLITTPEIPAKGSLEPWLNKEKQRALAEFGFKLAASLIQERFGDGGQQQESLYKRVDVRGYLRSDGTYVRPHVRYVPVNSQ